MTREKQKVYIIMLHQVGENPSLHSVCSTRELAIEKCELLNTILRNDGLFADFISEVVDE